MSPTCVRIYPPSQSSLSLPIFSTVFLFPAAAAAAATPPRSAPSNTYLLLAPRNPTPCPRFWISSVRAGAACAHWTLPWLQGASIGELLCCAVPRRSCQRREWAWSEGIVWCNYLLPRYTHRGIFLMGVDGRLNELRRRRMRRGNNTTMQTHSSINRSLQRRRRPAEPSPAQSSPLCMYDGRRQ
ncbi:uncharacterized protein J3D65DRAFT_632168 [Phyllosticta citribraziliensis]|uniref:Secreted protein n=1 Tax=Phyllosticta citribraziliensis TaxID=989973 RepID=A0ABR1LFM7_9PEZI